MSMPPQGGWPPPQPGPQPPNQPPYGPPPGYQPYPGQQPYPPQGQWQQPPPPPQKSGGATKWLLVAIAVLLVIGVTIGATLLFTRDGDGSSTPSNSDVPSDIASANDTGPVEIITEEPTCEAYTSVNDSLSRLQQQGWGDIRGRLGPRDSWTSDEASKVEQVTRAMTNASDRLTPLAAQTPHRVVRELYESYMAYGRAYAESINEYQPADNYLASVNVNAADALTAICTAIENGAANRSIAIDSAAPPRNVAPIGEPALFLSSPDPACESWIRREDQNGADLSEWAQLNTDVPATQWSPEQRATQLAAIEILGSFSDATAAAAEQSENPTVNDFGQLASLYIDTYVSARDSYTSADSWLSAAGLRLTNVVTDACRAADG